jgi:hypothetical protein
VTGLGADSIQRVKVYGRKTGDDFPAWTEEFVIGEAQTAAPHSAAPHSALDKLIALSKIIPKKQSGLKEKAQQGDIEAITQLLNQPIKQKKIIVKVDIQADCLQLMLESEKIPEMSLAQVMSRKIMMLELEFVKIVKIYGRQTNAQFPAWTQELDLRLQNPLTQNMIDSSNFSIERIIGTKLVSKLMVIIGCIFLCVGIFAPIMSLPLIGNVNYLYLKGDSIIILILAIISLIIILQDKYQLLWITATTTLGVIIIGFFHTQLLLLQVRVGIEELLSPAMFRGLVDVAVNSIQIQWGWILLFLGVGSMIAGIIIQERIYINELGYIGYFSQIFAIKTAEKTYSFLGLIFLGIITIKLVFGQNNLLYTSSNNQLRVSLAKQVQAKDYIRSINLSQQVFYLEHKKFAPRLNELELSIPEETKNYKYTIVNIDDTKTIATAIAKEDGLKSYLGHVFIINDGTNIAGDDKESLTRSISCQSNKPSKKPPQVLQTMDNQTQCPAEYSLLVHP